MARFSGKRPVGTGRLFFSRSACARCGRHLVLERKSVEYQITASKKATEERISALHKAQQQLIESGKLDAHDFFSRSLPKAVLINDLLPTQPGLDPPDKFCFVANRQVLDLPIIIARVGGISIYDHQVSVGVRDLMAQGKYVILDGHTRAAVKLAEAKNQKTAAINAIVLSFPNALSYFESHLHFRREAKVSAVHDLLLTAKYSGFLKKEKRPKHPEACPGLTKRKR